MQSISSSLGANLSSSTAGGGYPSGSSEQVNIGQMDVCSLEEDMDVPEIVEEIIDLLLTGLRDSVCSHPDFVSRAGSRVAGHYIKKKINVHKYKQPKTRMRNSNT